MINLTLLKDIFLVDSQERKSMKWNLHNYQDIITINNKFFINNNQPYPAKILNYDKENLILIKGDYKPFVSQENAITKLQNKFTYMEDLLSKFGENLVAAGGAVLWSLRKTHGEPEDIDFFFYGKIDENEANVILTNIIKFLCKYEKPLIEQNQYVTSILFRPSAPLVDEDNNHNNHNHNNHIKIIKYQFIHRIYPTKASIIGGFDIPASSILFDGTDFLTTTLGAFCIGCCTNLMDLTKRSTTYESRLRKYLSKKCISILIHSFDLKRYNNEVCATDYFDTVHIRYLQIGPHLKLNSRRNEYYLTRLDDEDNLEKNDYSGAGSFKHHAIINAYLASHNKLDYISFRYKNVDDYVGGGSGEREKRRAEYKFEPDMREGLGANFVLKWFGKEKFQEMFDKHRTEILREGKNWRINTKIYQTEIVELGQLIKRNIEMTVPIVKWITKSPQTQWTSSINPVYTKPSEYYDSKYYRPLYIGIDSEVESLVRLTHRNKGADNMSEFKRLPKDMINYIFLHVYKLMRQDLLDYLFNHIDSKNIYKYNGDGGGIGEEKMGGLNPNMTLGQLINQLPPGIGMVIHHPEHPAHPMMFGLIEAADAQENHDDEIYGNDDNREDEYEVDEDDYRHLR